MELGFSKCTVSQNMSVGWSCSSRFSESSPAADSQSWVEVRQGLDCQVAFLLTTLPPPMGSTAVQQAHWARDKLLENLKRAGDPCSGRGREVPPWPGWGGEGGGITNPEGGETL